MTATITLANHKTFRAGPGLALLDAAEADGLLLEHGCRTGRCGGCKAQVTSGTTIAIRAETSLPAAEAAAGWILTCAREATSDVSLDIDDLGALATIGTRTMPCRIDGLERLAPDVMKITLRLPPNAGFAFLAGQYIDITGPNGIKRSYSIASDSAVPGKLALHVRAVEGGEMSRYWFHEAKANDLLRFRGPLGTFFLRDVAGLDLVFLATGTGIAPILSMMAQLPRLAADQRPASVSLFWGGRQAEDLYCAMPDSVRYIPVLSRASAWDGARGHVQDAFLASQPSLDRSTVYACGSPSMTEGARARLIAAGLPVKRFHADAFVSSN